MDVSPINCVILAIFFQFPYVVRKLCIFCRDLFLNDDVWLLYLSLELFSKVP